MMIKVKDKNYGEDDCKVAMSFNNMGIIYDHEEKNISWYIEILPKKNHLPIGRACCLEYSKSIVSDFHQI